MNKLIGWCLAVIITIIGFSASNAQDTPISDAYALLHTGENNGALTLINPSRPDSPVSSLLLPVSDVLPQYAIVQVTPSPDGKKLAIQADDLTTGINHLFVYHLPSGELRYIATDLLTPELVWDANGRYVAFNAEGLTDIVATYVYDTDSASLHKVFQSTETLPTIQPNMMIFTPDGTHLVLFNDVCWNTLCHGLILSVAHQSQAIVAMVEMTEPAIALHHVCMLGWSPDHRYLMFVTLCGDFAERYFSELFLWDDAQHQVYQLTAYTNSWSLLTADMPVNEYSVHHAGVWVNSSMMLTGHVVAEWGLLSDSTYGMLSDQAVVETMQYLAPDFTKTDMMSGVSLLDFVAHPTQQGRIAYRVQDYTTDPNGELVLRPARVEIAQFNNEQLQPVYQEAYRCELSWSPSGVWLKYLTSDGSEDTLNPCWGRDALMFLNNNTGHTYRHILPQTGYIQMVGWIALDQALCATDGQCME